MAGGRASIAPWVGAICLLIAACGDEDDRHGMPTVPVPTATATPRVEPTPPGFANLQHVIIVMQENHSFDNYFGVLPYAADSPYHSPPTPGSACPADDARCVDGLTCTGTTPPRCANRNFT